MSSPPGGAGLALAIAPTVACLAAAQRRLAGFLEAAGVGAGLRLRTELAVEEAVMNVVLHAAGARALRLEARPDEDGVALAIEDDGPAFDPLALAPPPLRRTLEQAATGGFGLRLIRATTRALRYRRTPEGRNRLEMLVVPAGTGDGGRDRD